MTGRALNDQEFLGVEGSGWRGCAPPEIIELVVPRVVNRIGFRFFKCHSARSCASGRTFVPKSAEFAFDFTGLICWPWFFAVSRSDSVLLAKAFTFCPKQTWNNPTCCTETHKSTWNPKCSRTARRCSSSSAVEPIA